MVRWKKKQVCGCEGTVAGMGSHSIAFLCGGNSFVFSVNMQQSCLTRFFLHCLVLTVEGVKRAPSLEQLIHPTSKVRLKLLRFQISEQWGMLYTLC
jgi:hypothetical protein